MELAADAAVWSTGDDISGACLSKVRPAYEVMAEAAKTGLLEAGVVYVNEDGRVEFASDAAQKYRDSPWPCHLSLEGNALMTSEAQKWGEEQLVQGLPRKMASIIHWRPEALETRQLWMESDELQCQRLEQEQDTSGAECFSRALCGAQRCEQYSNPLAHRSDESRGRHTLCFDEAENLWML